MKASKEIGEKRAEVENIRKDIQLILKTVGNSNDGKISRVIVKEDIKQTKRTLCKYTLKYIYCMDKIIKGSEVRDVSHKNFFIKERSNSISYFCNFFIEKNEVISLHFMVILSTCRL